MINLQTNTLKGGQNEQKFSAQLEKEDIPFKYGRIKANGDQHESLFIVGRYAVSFDNFSPSIQKALTDNKLVPQVWHPSELQWQDLSLGRRLAFHP